MALLERCGEVPVHLARVGAGDHSAFVSLAGEQLRDLLIARPAEYGRAGDLVLIEVQDRQHRPVARRVEEAHPLPGALKRRGLRLAVADHTGYEEVGIVKGGAEGVNEGIAQLAALVDRPGGWDADVTGNPTGRRELTHQVQQPGLVHRGLGVELGVGALEVDVRHHRRAAVTRPGDEEDVGACGANQPVQLGIDEVQSWRGAPVAEQAWLDVLGTEWLSQQRIPLQVDLGDGEVVGRLPIGQKTVKLRVRALAHPR